jgi:hypothetical protein
MLDMFSLATVFVEEVELCKGVDDHWDLQCNIADVDDE